jgi:hypothetical protein
MRIRFCVFGREVFACEVIRDDVTEESIAALVESLGGSVNQDDLVSDSDTNDADLTVEISGGHSHNFERDDRPLTPEDRYRYEWVDKFGFCQ